MTEIMPIAVHESVMSRMERTIKRLWILCIILIGVLVATNAGWIYYESQFITEETTVEQEIDTGDGDATVIGVGDYNNGENTSDSINEE